MLNRYLARAPRCIGAREDLFALLERAAKPVASLNRVKLIYLNLEFVSEPEGTLHRVRCLIEEMKATSIVFERWHNFEESCEVYRIWTVLIRFHASNHLRRDHAVPSIE